MMAIMDHMLYCFSNPTPAALVVQEWYHHTQGPHSLPVEGHVLVQPVVYVSDGGIHTNIQQQRIQVNPQQMMDQRSSSHVMYSTHSRDANAFWLASYPGPFGVWGRRNIFSKTYRKSHPPCRWLYRRHEMGIMSSMICVKLCGCLWLKLCLQ